MAESFKVMTKGEWYSDLIFKTYSSLNFLDEKLSGLPKCFVPQVIKLHAKAFSEFGQKTLSNIYKVSNTDLPH